MSVVQISHVTNIWFRRKKFKENTTNMVHINCMDSDNSFSWFDGETARFLYWTFHEYISYMYGAQFIDDSVLTNLFHHEMEIPENREMTTWLSLIFNIHMNQNNMGFVGYDCISLIVWCEMEFILSDWLWRIFGDYTAFTTKNKSHQYNIWTKWIKI